MKKIAIFCSVLALVGMASCDDKSDLGVIQTNEQQTVMSAGGVTLTAQAPFTGTSIDLSRAAGNDVLNVLTYTTKEALPAGAHMEFVMELGSDANYTKSTEIHLTPGANSKAAYSMTAEELENAVFTLFGKEPIVRTVSTRVAAYIVNGTQTSRVRDNNAPAWFMGQTIAITPEDLNLSELEYYFVDSLTGMNPADGKQMVHSDKHPYDDPLFSYVIEVTKSDLTAGNVKWAIAPKSAVASNNSSEMLGAEAGADLTAMKGNLVKGGVAFEFYAPAKYQVRIDVQAMTYEIGFANDQLYVFTPKDNFKSRMGLHTNDYVHYSGIGYLNGSWNLTGEPDQLHLKLGQGSAAGTMELIGRNMTTPMFASPTGDLKDKLYKIDCNLQEMTYNIICAQTLGVVGGNNNWGNVPGDAPEGTEPVADTPLVNAGGNNNVWKATVTFSDANNLQFKLRANNNWGSNDDPSFDFGYDNSVPADGNKRAITFGGSNMSVPEVGTYEITVDFTLGNVVGSPLPYYITVVKK